MSKYRMPSREACQANSHRSMWSSSAAVVAALHAGTYNPRYSEQSFLEGRRLDLSRVTEQSLSVPGYYRCAVAFQERRHRRRDL